MSTETSTDEMIRRLQNDLDASLATIESLKDALVQAVQERDEARSAAGFVAPLVPGLETEELRLLGLDDGAWHVAVARVYVRWHEESGFEVTGWQVSSEEGSPE